MPRLHRSKLNSKSTIKMPEQAIAFWGSGRDSMGQLKHAQLVGQEVARNNHSLNISEINASTLAAVAAARRYNGSTRGYFPSPGQSGDETTLFSRLVYTDTDFSHNLESMLQSSAAILLLIDKGDELRLLTQPVPEHILVGVIANGQDLSHCLLDIATVSDIRADAFFIDSSPANLVRRMLKRLRQQQLQAR